MSINTSIGNTAPEEFYKRLNSPEVLKYAEQNRKKGFFIDVTIQTKSQKFSANRMILSCCSRYFETMFTANMKERYQPSAEVESVDADSMRDLIEYIYTGEITINCENVCRILSAADYLQIDDVKGLCFNYLEKALSPGNCFTLLAIADVYRNQSLKVFSEEFVVDNFREVLLSDGFKQCSKQDLIDLISKLRKSRVEETLIYRSIVGWTKHDEENRAPGFYDLLILIKLDKLPSQFMEDEVCDEELLTVNPDCAKLLNQAIKKRLKVIRTKESSSTIVSIGGADTPFKTIEVYNFDSNPFSTFPDLPQGRRSGCVVKMRDSIYFVGGRSRDEYTASNTVWSMNLKDDALKWKEEPPLNVERMIMGAALFSDCLVVVGGATGFPGDRLSSCEAYSPSSNSWTNIPSLNQTRSGLTVVSCRGCLYALGGVNEDDSYSSSVERMFAFGKWENIKSMQTPRRWLAAVSCNDVVYAIGGQAGAEDDTVLKSVEKFDSAAGEWSYVSDMCFSRCALSACVFQGKIFVVGGLNRKKIFVKEIECYNPVTDKWSVVAKTAEVLYGHSVVVI